MFKNTFFLIFQTTFSNNSNFPVIFLKQFIRLIPIIKHSFYAYMHFLQYLFMTVYLCIHNCQCFIVWCYEKWKEIPKKIRKALWLFLIQQRCEVWSGKNVNFWVAHIHLFVPMTWQITTFHRRSGFKNWRPLHRRKHHNVFTANFNLLTSSNAFFEIMVWQKPWKKSKNSLFT